MGLAYYLALNEFTLILQIQVEIGRQAASDLGGRTRHLHCSVPAAAAAARGTANPTDQIDHQEHDHGHEQRKMNRREELMRLNYVLK